MKSVYLHLTERSAPITKKELVDNEELMKAVYTDNVDKVKEEFKNVIYSFKSGATCDKIRNDIIRFQDKTGKKVRLVIIDYLESVQSGINDPTVGSGIVAQELFHCAWLQ